MECSPTKPIRVSGYLLLASNRALFPRQRSLCWPGEPSPKVGGKMVTIRSEAALWGIAREQSLPRLWISADASSSRRLLSSAFRAPEKPALVSLDHNDGFRMASANCVSKPGGSLCPIELRPLNHFLYEAKSKKPRNFIYNFKDHNLFASGATV